MEYIKKFDEINESDNDYGKFYKDLSNDQLKIWKEVLDGITKEGGNTNNTQVVITYLQKNYKIIPK
jgi:predicted oxidoreductase